MDENRTILGILSSAVGEYLSMRTDDFKKNIVTSLSVGFSRVLAVLVIILILILLRKRLFLNFNQQNKLLNPDKYFF